MENSHIRSSYMTHIISVLYLRRRDLIKSQVKLQPCFLIDGIFNRFLYVTLDFLLEVRRLVFTCQPSLLYTQLHPLITNLRMWVLFLPHFRRSGIKTRMLLPVNYSNRITLVFQMFYKFRQEHVAHEQSNPWNLLQLQDAVMFQSRDCYQPHPSGPKPYVNVSAHTAPTEQ